MMGLYREKVPVIGIHNKDHGVFFLCNANKKNDLIKEYFDLTGIKLEEFKQNEIKGTKGLQHKL